MNKLEKKDLVKHIRGRVFVFVDAANLEKSVQDLGWRVNYRKLRAYFRNNTDLRSVRFYSVSFGNAPHNDFLDSLRAKGYRVVTKPLKIIKDDSEPDGEIRKADFDVEIAVDAIDKLNEYDTMILFSGDSDFDYLVKVLRQKGKKAVVFSTKHHIAKELIRSCDKYIDLKRLKADIARKPRKK